MFNYLNPILKDGEKYYDPTRYIHGTYRMVFIRTYQAEGVEDASPEM